ncbi:MAG: [protein-PII] uridylyltransferase [Proteobacteria bacterium]|nr:[protein-PII] uridylyltransferase [Pseudomonadota bacterium]
MAALAHKRRIIDRRALMGDLARIGGVAPAGAARTPLLERFKRALADGRAEVRRRFDEGAPGPLVAAGNSHLVDQLVRALFDFATHTAYPMPNPSAGERLAVVAVGGYGRGELAPYSDIDLLFLLPYKLTPRVEQAVEFMLYMLWDLGLKVGHATRSVRECLRRARGDMTIRTNLLEARYVCGDRPLCRELRRRFAAELVKGSGPEFVRAKLDERNQRHARMGDSRYVLEPNIKDGKGGLRDLHTLLWIAKYLYGVGDVAKLVGRGVLQAEEHARFVKAHAFLWTIRCQLHYLAGRAEERLTFDVQPEIARRTRYAERAGAKGVERFMKHYFLVAKDVGDLTRIFCAAIEAEHEGASLIRLPRLGAFRREVDGFVVERGRLTVRAEDAFARDPAAMIRLFHVADARGLDIHPWALRLITRNLKRIGAKLRADPEANRLFVEILTSRNDPETALRRMNEAGVLGRLIPDFGRVVAQMQHDMYHVYTVDEHTIFAIGILARIERGELADSLPLATGIVHEVLSRRVLYLALFLHDVAKGRGGDHSALGAEIALKLGARLDFSPEEAEQVAWLVRHHLLFSATAFQRDLDDPKTVTDFVAQVQSLERLRLLLVLTAADIRAVGPNVWNDWKGSLLRQLYGLAAEVISGGHAAEAKDERVAAAKQALTQALADWPEDAIKRHLGRLYPPYWLGFDTATHARHAETMRAAERAGAPITLDTRVDRRHGVTEITLFTPDQPGLFSKVAGAMALAGASIVNARIYTTSDGMALDIFWVHDAAGGPFERADKLARLSALAEQALTGRRVPGDELARRRSLPSRAAAVFTVEPRVLIDNNASTRHTVIEVNGRDRPGLLHDVTRALSDLAVSIVTAHVSTYGERAVDVFYVKDVFGLKIEHEAKLAKIRARLLEALAEPSPAAARAPAGNAAAE